MAARVCVFCLAFLLGTLGARDESSELIVWNVGQGQWATIIDGQACWHLDMGGEFAPWRAIRAACRSRQNVLSLSHWDMDHLDFVGGARSQLPNLCLLNAPLGRSSPRKESLLAGIPTCPFKSPYVQWSNPAGKTANAKSWVVLWRGVLAPGDSPRDQEQHWIGQLEGLSATRILILGHHGSRTSTSRGLLSSLPHLQVAIASSRFKRYHHPHAEVVHELLNAHVPLLRTEEWGTIHLRLD